MTNILKTERLKTDILIIGGGTARLLCSSYCRRTFPMLKGAYM